MRSPPARKTESLGPTLMPWMKITLMCLTGSRSSCGTHSFCSTPSSICTTYIQHALEELFSMISACSGWSIGACQLSTYWGHLWSSWRLSHFQLFAFATGHARSGYTALLQDILLRLKLNWLRCTCFALRMLIRLDRQASSLWFASCNSTTPRPRPPRRYRACCSLMSWKSWKQKIKMCSNFFPAYRIISQWKHRCRFANGLHAEFFPSCMRRQHRQHWLTHAHTHTPPSLTPTPLPPLLYVHCCSEKPFKMLKAE